jgi:4-hydroxy-2-oxoheptanedioate aldolase
MYGGRGYAAEANSEIACIAMIETREGIENLEDIVTTPNLGGIYIGPSDLALALDLPPNGDTDNAVHIAKVGEILECCQKHGVPAGIHTNSLAFAQRRIEAGFDFVTLGSDAGFLMTAVYEQLAKARGTAEKHREATGY